MANKIFHGSCYYQRIKFQANIDMTIEELNSIPVVCYNGANDSYDIITDPEIIKTL